jgi:FkbH-like protein
MIICDLDNTLWEGSIGEGSVCHIESRQEILLALRKKGILLSVVSKNDARNVRWEGCRLAPDDFVGMQINWETKANNIRSIAKRLNLKEKDMIFIDDRADEREMVHQAIPEIRVLDACDQQTWLLLSCWAELLENETDTNRTRYYKEREEREKYVNSSMPDAAKEDPAEIFSKLKITVRMRPALETDFRRLAELINRTNQFNLCGTRTSLKEIKSWHGDNWGLFVVEAADKFGPMGMVCAAVTCQRNGHLEIPVFVLSCRVFGYGIEKAFLNYLKSLSSQSRPLIGFYKPTGYNELCKDFYLDNGFTMEGDQWVFEGVDIGIDPPWLQVTRP